MHSLDLTIVCFYLTGTVRFSAYFSRSHQNVATETTSEDRE